MTGVSIIIPTLGEDEYRLVGLLDSLCQQTVAPNSVLLCVDGPQGDTVKTLAAWKHGAHPFEFRLFQRTAPKTVEHGGPGLAEQILFANVKGDVILHMDSDGYVDKHAVEFVISQDLCKPMMRCLWGQNVFHDAETGAKLPHPDPRIDRYPKEPGVYKMPPAPVDANGALWAIPTAIIKDIGGHDMRGIDYRGQDSRLGQRIQAICECDFVTDRRFQFHHFGLPTQYSLLHSSATGGRGSREERYKAAQDVLRFKESHRLPQLGNCPMDLIVNGGARGWGTYGLSEMYQEIV